MSHLSIKWNTKFSSTSQEENKKSSLDYKLAKRLLYLKTTTTSIMSVIFLAWKTLIKNQLKENGENPIISRYVVKLQNLISRISVPPFQK